MTECALICFDERVMVGLLRDEFLKKYLGSVSMGRDVEKMHGLKSDQQDLAKIEWLLSDGGPVIRYRTARELLDKPPAEIADLAEELLQSPLVNMWLDRLGPSKEFNDLHSSKVTAYENAMGKLIQLGCCSGMPAFDEKTKPFRDCLWDNNPSTDFDWTPFMRMVVGSFLCAAGYHQEPAIQAYLQHRLEILWRFTRKMDFDIYTDRAHYPDIPKGFHDKPLVKPELYMGNEMQFPSIYDIYALAHYPVHLQSQEIQQKIEAVIEYVLHPGYQAFPEGYGLMKTGKRKYYAIGWSVHLPQYSNLPEKRDENRLIQRLVLMSNFPAARKHPWFRENVARLEHYRTDHGTYIFPRSFLQERPSGYWVTGAYMGLEEDRRNRSAIELESTFWMLKIKKNIAVQANSDGNGVLTAR